MNCFDRDYEIFCGWSCDCPFFLCFSWVFGHKVYLNCRTNVYFLWRCTTINELMINEQVRDREVRVISSNGEQLGIMSSKEAMKLAREAELDLVKIAPQAKPPVCKIMDYGKYKFELNKREKENRKNQKVINIKEVQLSPSIDTNDFNTKCNHAIKFLKKGDKVKVIVRFRGREVSHSQIGYTLLERFAEQAKEAGTVEKPAKLEGRNMTMFLAPLS